MVDFNEVNIDILISYIIYKFGKGSIFIVIIDLVLLLVMDWDRLFFLLCFSVLDNVMFLWVLYKFV